MKESDSLGEKGARTRHPVGKVAKLIQKYKMDGLGDELEELWTRDGDRMSLRELAKHFNKHLVVAALIQNGNTVLDGEAKNYHHLLTGEDVSSGTRIQAENKLQKKGVDVDELRSDFVSRQSIHTYLTKVRNTEFTQNEKSSEERTNVRINTIRRLKSRLSAVTNNLIEESVASTQGDEGKATVTVLVQVTCEECGSQYPVTEYLANGGCRCR